MKREPYVFEQFGMTMSPRSYYEKFSEWLDDKAEGWSIREDAPEDIKALFNEYMEGDRKAKAAGYYID